MPLSYRTEVVIPPDRYLCLQLPGHLPEGRATVVVTVDSEEAEPTEASAHDWEDDSQDIEWWDEFEGEEAGTETEPAPEETVAAPEETVAAPLDPDHPPRTEAES